MNSMKIVPFILTLAFLPISPSLAQDSGLYDTAPAGSAFVRVMNFEDEADKLFTVNGQDYDMASFAMPMPYHPVVKRSIRVEAGDEGAKHDTEEGKFYTVIAVPEKEELLILQDQALENPAKAIIHFYNLTDRLTLALKASEGKIAVTMANQNDTGHREINAVPVKLALYDGETKVTDVPESILERGKAMTIVAYGSGEEIKVVSQPSDMTIIP